MDVVPYEAHARMGLTNRGRLCYNHRKYRLNRRGHARSRAHGQGTSIRRTVVTNATAGLRFSVLSEQRGISIHAEIII